LDSDTVTDVWHPTVGKTDDYKQPFATASTTAISIMDNTLAIGANDTNSGGFWSETGAESLDRKLTKPKTVFTVIDNIQTPRITTVTGNLTISSATSTSLTIGTATTTGATIQIKAGPSQNLLLSGDSNTGLYVTAGGNVGIGTTGPYGLLSVLGSNSADVFVGGQVATVDSAGDAVINLGMARASGAFAAGMKSIQSWDGVQSDYTLKLQVHDGGVGDVTAATILSSGNVGIGTTTPAAKLDISTGTSGVSTGYSLTGLIIEGAASGNWLEFRNTAVGNAGITWADPNAADVANIYYAHDDNSMRFKTNGTNRVTIDSSGNVVITGNCSDAAGGGGCTADYAEVYQRDINDKDMAMTDILALDSNNGKVTRADKSAGKTNLIGVYSSAPGSLIGQRKSSIELGKGTGVMAGLDPDEIPVALNGRVPVKVNLEGGDIKIGDKISLSSIPGVGMKIVKGPMVGIAMEESTAEKPKDTIQLFINLSYAYDDSSIVPIFDGKIDAMAQRIDKQDKKIEELRGGFEKLKQEVKEIKRKR